MSEMPFLSVIIPTCHRNDLLALCLDQLKPSVQLLDSEYYEVIVTDDGSSSTAEAMILREYPWARWVQGPRKGPAANRNNGARVSMGSWLIFIDDDCVPDKELLKNYKEAIEQNSTIFAFEGAILPEREYNTANEECPVNLHGNCFWSANIAIDRNLFINIKGFDEHFLIAAQEDQDLFIQIKKYTKVKFLLKTFVTHPIRKLEIKNIFPRLKIRSKNFLYYALKNKKELNYKSKLDVIIKSYIFHFRTIIKSIQNKNLYLIINSLAMICCGIPYYFFLNSEALIMNDKNNCKLSR